MPSAAIISNGILLIGYCNEALSIIYDDIKKYKKEINHSFLKEKLIKNKLDSYDCIELEKVSFSYNNSKNKILDKVDFKLNKMNLLEHSNTGSGKTTFIDILLGFLKPTEGQVLINKKSQDTSLLVYLGKVGYLPQENFIINDSIEANICLNYDKNEINKKLKKYYVY